MVGQVQSIMMVVLLVWHAHEPRCRSYACLWGWRVVIELFTMLFKYVLKDEYWNNLVLGALGNTLEPPAAQTAIHIYIQYEYICIGLKLQC